MIVIVDGIDRVGKTILCNTLAEHGYNKIKGQLNISHMFQDKAMFYASQEVGMLEVMKQTTKVNFVVDRFHWSEYVYGKHVRGYKSKYTEQIEYILETTEGVKIILVCPIDILRSSKEHGLDLSGYQKDFERLYEDSHLDKFKCTYDTLTDACKWAIN